MNKKTLTLLLFLICFGANTQAQDPAFTQYYFTPNYTNPALAGTGKGCGGRLLLGYRNQWPSLGRTYETYSAAYDRQIDKLKGGVGALLTHDVAGSGLLTTTNFALQYAYEIKLKDALKLRLGIQTGLVYKSLDFNKLTFSEMIEPRSGFVFPTNEPIPTNSITFPNFSGGALLYNTKIHLGFAVHNILEPNQSFYKSTSPGAKLPIRLTVHGGYKVKLSKSAYLLPNFLVMQQQQFLQLNAGLMFGYKKLMAGVSFRQTRPNSDASIFILGYNGKRFSGYYSYDRTVSDARVAATGSHEITLAYNFGCKKGRESTVNYNFFQ